MIRAKNIRTSASISRNPDQTDQGLGFNGQNNSDTVPSLGNKYSGNQHAGRQDPNKTFNMGRPEINTRGNQGRDANQGPKQPPVSRSLPNTQSAAVSMAAGTYSGAAPVRTPGGTRTWAPAAGQNYHGNPDMIREGRGPTRGNAQ